MNTKTTRPDLSRHTPTPDEIRAACREIRAGWTKKQEEDRRAISNDGSTLPAVVVHVEYWIPR